MLAVVRVVILSVLLLFLPSQLAVHFWPSWSVLNGFRIDYLSPTLYFTDILVIILCITWLLELRRKRKSFNLNPFWLLAILVALTNIFFSALPTLSLFKFLKLSLYVVFYLYLYDHRRLVRSLMPKFLGLAVIWTVLLACGQFYLKSNVGGVMYWVGERPISMSMPGIARYSLGNAGWFIRPYATFPHPNALSGFLLLSMMSLVYLGVLSFPFAFILCFPFVLLTFSKTSFLLMMSWLMLYILLRKNQGNKVIIGFSVILGSLFVYLAIFLLNWTSSVISVLARIDLVKESLSLIGSSPLFGTGLGTYPYLSILGHQPVHNVFLLIFAELGLAGLIIIIWLVKYLLRYFVWDFPLVCVVLLIIIGGMVDHYWLTSHQNVLLLITYFSIIPSLGRRV